jgi:hypothetical protein
MSAVISALFSQSRARFAALTLTLISTQLFASSIAGLNGMPLMRVYSLADIGIDSSGWSILKDRDDTLLFGFNTLVTFDGERWHRVPLANTYGLRHLELDSEDRLWAALQGDIGWFERRSEGWRFHSLREQLGPLESTTGEIFKVYADKSGVTFVGVNAILRWRDNHFESWSMPGTRRLLGNRIDGKIYVHYVRDGIYVMTEKGPELAIPQTVFGDRAIVWMEKMGQDILMASSQGLLRYHNGDIIPFDPEVYEFLNQNG